METRFLSQKIGVPSTGGGRLQTVQLQMFLPEVPLPLLAPESGKKMPYSPLRRHTAWHCPLESAMSTPHPATKR